MRHLCLIPIVVLSFFATSCQEPAADQPNILWITAEDMSPVLGYNGDDFAITPNLDELATESVIYTNAFATAPVCSPSRAAIINGITAPAQGAHQMRSAFPLPNEFSGFPALMREAGYYTTNNVKTDYNSGSAEAIIAASWDESSDSAGWWGRDEGQPFFAVFNHMVSHQSRTMQWPYEQFVSEVQSQLSPEEIHDPETSPLPPYYPDTPVVRTTLARFYDCVTVLDKQIGDLLKRLEDDGLLDNTIIFFYSDHGSGMPRHKRIVLDSGFRVPMLVRFPEKYQHLAPAAANEEESRLVDFADFGPTVLSLAGIDVPEYMQGLPFLGGQDAGPKDFVYGHRDRIDEAVDMSRAVRDQQYLYVRHYMPHLAYHLQSAWPDMGEINGVFEGLNPEQISDAVRHYVGPGKPIEELYDSNTDPMNLNNLVDSPEHQEVLRRLRSQLREQLVNQRDLGFVPEIEMLDYADGTTPYEWAHSGAYDIEAYMSAAEAVGTDDFDTFRAGLTHEIVGVRYWSAMGYTAAAKLPESESAPLKEALNDPSPAVQIEAASALIRHNQVDEALAKLRELIHHENPTVVIYATRAIELAGDKAKAAYDDMKALYEATEGKPDPHMFIWFSAKGYLDRVSP